MRNIPSPLLLLAIISRYEYGVTVHELTEILDSLQKRGIDLGYKFVPLIKSKISKELLLDINLLKVLNLVTEVNGRLVVTERAKNMISKIITREEMLKKILAYVDGMKYHKEAEHV